MVSRGYKMIPTYKYKSSIQCFSLYFAGKSAWCCSSKVSGCHSKIYLSQSCKIIVPCKLSRYIVFIPWAFGWACSIDSDKAAAIIWVPLLWQSSSMIFNIFIRYVQRSFIHFVKLNLYGVIMILNTNVN